MNLLDAVLLDAGLRWPDVHGRIVHEHAYQSACQQHAAGASDRVVKLLFRAALRDAGLIA